MSDARRLRRIGVARRGGHRRVREHRSERHFSRTPTLSLEQWAEHAALALSDVGVGMVRRAAAAMELGRCEVVVARSTAYRDPRARSRSRPTALDGRSPDDVCVRPRRGTRVDHVAPNATLLRSRPA